MTAIQNPVLRGFNPDPSICRVGDDYYIATSTFEWFPGVQIHHSRDLKNWKLIARPLNRHSQLNLIGVPDSCGVWAPCLSYNDGVFYLVYTNVKSFDGVWKDTPNYLVTTEDILGDWSEPIYLSSRGFDGSLFHDYDSRKWFINMLVDHRNGKFFGGIEMQEFDPDLGRLKGPVHYLTAGSDLGCTEGPHLYKKDDFYYLIIAEGGTEYGHAVSVARSRTLLGPYEFHPDNPIISAVEDEYNLLQKSGHGDLVQTQNGEWYLVFLVGRPLSPHGNCTLGRETAIEEIIWKDNWPYAKSGSRIPRNEIPAADLAPDSYIEQTGLRYFDNSKIPLEFQALRRPIDDSWANLQERAGYLRLYGNESLTSTHKQSLLARRIQHFNVEITISMDFRPEHMLHMAGLVFYYNTGHYHYAHLSANEDGTEKYLSIITANNFQIKSQEQLVEIRGSDSVFLKGHMKNATLQFYYSLDNDNYVALGSVLDAGILSDDYVREGGQRYRPAFTGSFVGICCQDLAMNQHYADFEWFKYKEYSDEDSH